MSNRSRRFFLCLGLLLSPLARVDRATAQDGAPGYKPLAYAIRNARLETGAGAAIEKGTIVVRDGLILAVGPVDQTPIPFDARVIEADGLTVYPGFIDLYTTAGASPGVERSATGSGRQVSQSEYALAATAEDYRNGITPEFQVASALTWPAAFAEARRKLGFTSLIAAPGGAIASGQSALVSTSGLPRREIVVQTPTALHINLRSPSKPGSLKSADDPTSASFDSTGGYPNSLMGIVAHLRQAFNDAAYHSQRKEHHSLHGGPRPPLDPALDALHAARTRQIPVWWEADSQDEIHRALDLAREFGTSAVIVGGREAAKVADRLKAENVPVVLRLDFPDEPKLPSEDDYRKQKPTERDFPLRVLADANTEWKDTVATAAALQKAGVRFAFSSDKLAKSSDFPARLRQVIEAGLSADAAIAALTREAAAIAGVVDRLGTLAPGKLGHLVAFSAPITDKKSEVQHLFVDGLYFDIKKDDDKKDEEKKDDDDKKADEEKKPDAEAKSDDTTKKQPDTTEPDEKPASEEKEKGESEAPAIVDPPSELDDDRRPRLKTGGSVLIKNAVILTASPAGTIAKGSILVRDGKIAAIGPDLEAPEGIKVIDAQGLVAMPGIIDSHSHMAISGGVNEMSLSLVPEVRVRDVVDGEDVGLYRALAGGVTTSRLLHGSANAVGGQDVVVKHRWGNPGSGLILQDEDRPTGVKFALGENVTRRSDRFPNTRMGVEATLSRAFDEARAYRNTLQAHRARIARGEPLTPFRRDLRLEAFADILDGELKIHSHCYRADEILMLLRLAERNGIRVQSLHHVLEGYKVAPEIAAHGASASTFSDWWAYKVEAYDAIPHNAALLTEAGAAVCIKSDSSELVRHLYHEAAKMVYYGRVSEAQALAMITINPAQELGLEHRIGSLEIGKDADIALFNSHPFDAFTRCELTLVDGEVYYQRSLGEDDKLVPREGDLARMPAPDPAVAAAPLQIKPSPGGAYVLLGATVHPVSGPAIENGVVVVEKGRITAVGGLDTATPGNAVRINLEGLHVWPGLIDAASLVGLSEIGSIRETQDYADSARFQPELRASVALRPDSALIGVTRANGVLSTLVLPTGGSIAGQGCLANLEGWLPPEMVVADELVLVVNIPRYSPANPAQPRPKDRPDPNKDRAQRLDQIKEQFRQARDYDRIRREAAQKQSPAPVPDPRLEALAPYALGQKPVVLRADRRREILDAIELAKALEIKPILCGGLEAWKVISELKESGMPVILTGVLRVPESDYDPTDSAYQNPKLLHEAGIPFAIRSTVEGADPATSSRNTPFEAAFAVAHGLPEEAALEAISLAPARILGVADQLGSIEPGKRANLVITAGPILQLTSQVKALFIDGRPLAPTSRHTDLYEKYRERLHQFQEGQTPLGLDR